jgi:hypothetical protein
VAINCVMERQQSLNARARDGWDRYVTHRAQVMDHLTRGRRDGRRRLCILGAGNCNDLDIGVLVATFGEVHLVDLDGDALRCGLERQAADAPPTVHLHIADVTGVATQLGDWRTTTKPTPTQFEALVDAATNAAPVPPIDGPFDCVASTCLLTQLVDSVRFVLGDHDPNFQRLALAIRDRHLRLIVELTSPGGEAVLFSDIVSTQTWPELADAPADDLPRMAAERVQMGDFFTGADPLRLRDFFCTDPVTAPQLLNVQLVKPWRWDFGPRQYAVCAVRLRHHGRHLRRYFAGICPTA